MVTVADSDAGAEVLSRSAEPLVEKRPSAFLLRLQESVRPHASTKGAVEMGTSTFTEVRQEAADADPHSLTYFAIGREN